jgi:hypothetical protein
VARAGRARFFWYGAQGVLPTAFWVLAGTSDLAAGSLAAYLLLRPESVRRTLAFHIFGLADSMVAVGTGLTLTLLQDPRMAPITVLPMALIPLWRVGISGATHIIAFDMLRRGTGFANANARIASVAV